LKLEAGIAMAGGWHGADCESSDRLFGMRRAPRIRDAHAFQTHWPQMRAAIWFHYDQRREGEPNWSLTDVDSAQSIFNQAFAALHR
jgi:hypothetical protein